MTDLTALAHGLAAGASRPLVATIDVPTPALLSAEAKRVELGQRATAAGDEALLATLLVRRALTDDGVALADALKRINAALKAIDMCHEPALRPYAGPAGELAGRARTLIANVTSPQPTLRMNNRPRGGTLPLTVLFHEGPIARAYLAMMAADGARPARIIELVAVNDLSSRRPVGGWLPPALRMRYQAWHHRQLIHHWPRLIAGRQPGLRNQVAAGAHVLGFDVATLADAVALRPLANYADEVIRVGFNGFADPALLALFARFSPGIFLFTGGGIVPRAVLNIPDTKYLHIHPGHLPEVRGADGAFWSLLTHHRLSASAFWMAPGIDQGDIVATAWLPEIRLGPREPALPDRAAYRAYYSYLDPWVRAAMLRDVLARSEPIDQLPSAPQNSDDGTTFHFMHAALREIAEARLFR